MSGTSEDIEQQAVIDPTAKNRTLPTMPLNDGSSGKNTTANLIEFMKNISQFDPCFRVHDEKNRELTLVYYDKIHNGCKVIFSLKRAVITIKRFLHGDVLENVDHTFDSTGFQWHVRSFFTDAELEKQKRFNDLQVEQKRLMAEQQKLKKQEEERLNEELTKAHVSKPQTCGGVDKCKICKHNKVHESLAYFHKSNFVFIGT
jgi:ferredoxin